MLNPMIVGRHLIIAHECKITAKTVVEKFNCRPICFSDER